MFMRFERDYPVASRNEPSLAEKLHGVEIKPWRDQYQLHHHL